MTSHVRAISSNGLFKYIALTKHRQKEVLNVIHNNFFKDEYISKSIGLNQAPDAIKELDELMLGVAKDGTSLIAIEEKTGKIAAITLSKIMRKQEEPRGYFNKTFNHKHPLARKFERINAAIDTSLNCYELLKTDCYIELMLAAVLPEFRQKNLATELTELSIKLAQALKDGENVQVPFSENDLPCDTKPTGLIGICTTLFSVQILKKSDFMVAKTVQFGDSFGISLAPIPVMYKFLK